MSGAGDGLFPCGDYLDSSQLHVGPDEVATLREGEDPGTEAARTGTGGLRRTDMHTPGLLSLPAERMHPFLAVYDLQPQRAHPLVFAPGVPVTAQVVGTERYTSGSKVAGLLPGRVAEGGPAKGAGGGRGRDSRS